MSAFVALCRDTYREVILASGQEGTTRKEALDIVVERVLPLIESGEVAVDAVEAIRRQTTAQDEKDKNLTDAALRALLDGQDSLGLDGDPALDVVVTLGESGRKALRHVTLADLRSMDRVRYRNVKAVQDAYAVWRDLFEAWEDKLARHGNIQSAFWSGEQQ